MLNFIRYTIYLSLVSIFILTSHATCHSKFDKQKKQYIIGYGSLINDHSQRATAANVGEGIPVEIKGFRRGWYHLGKDQIFLGAVRDPKYGFNAKVFSVNNVKQIEGFDQREKNYCRKKVPESQIKVLAKQKVDGEVWIYVAKQPKDIDYLQDKASIELSYLYTFLSGCLNTQKEFGLKKFLEECINYTYDWPHKIRYDLDDRSKLRSTRSLPDTNDMKKINKLLCSNKKVLQHINKDSEFYIRVCRE